MAHLGLEVCHLVCADVRGVSSNQIEPAVRLPVQDIRLNDLQIGALVQIPIPTQVTQRLLGQLHSGQPSVLGQILAQGDWDAAGAGAQVAQLRSQLSVAQLQRRFDQNLGVGAGNQNALSDQKGQAEKFPLTQKILQRIAAQTAEHPLLEHSLLFGIGWVIQMQQQPGLGKSGQLLEQQLGFVRCKPLLAGMGKQLPIGCHLSSLPFLGVGLLGLEQCFIWVFGDDPLHRGNRDLNHAVVRLPGGQTLGPQSGCGEDAGEQVVVTAGKFDTFIG